MNQGIRRSAMYFLLLFSLGLDWAVIGPVLPALSAQTESTLGAIGMVFLLGAAGGALGTLLSGWMFDWAPGRTVLGAAQLCSAGLLFLVPHVPWFGLLLVFFSVKGIGAGVINTGANTLLSWTHREKAGPFVNALHFFYGLGSFLSPFLLGLVIASGGTYRDSFHLLAGIDATIGMLVLLTLQSPLPLPKQPADGSAEMPALRAAPIVLSAAFFLFFYVSAELTFGGWISTYAITLHMADVVRAAYLTSVFWLVFTLGRLISIPAAIRFSPRQIIPVALAGCAGFLGLLILVPGSSAVLWIAAAGTGFCMAPIWPTGYTLAGQSLRLTARVSSLILLGDGIGGMILPGLMGLLMERAGTEAMAPVVLGSIAATFIAFLAVLLFGRKQKSPADRLVVEPAPVSPPGGPG